MVFHVLLTLVDGHPVAACTRQGHVVYTHTPKTAHIALADTVIATGQDGHLCTEEQVFAVQVQYVVGARGRTLRGELVVYDDLNVTAVSLHGDVMPVAITHLDLVNPSHALATATVDAVLDHAILNLGVEKETTTVLYQAITSDISYLV